MCSYSMIGDHYTDKFRQRDWYQPNAVPMPGSLGFTLNPSQISRAEFDALKAEVAEMVALLKRAKKYDEDNGEPDCEMEDKIKVLRAVAKLVGVDLDKATGLNPNAQIPTT